MNDERRPGIARWRSARRLLQRGRQAATPESTYVLLVLFAIALIVGTALRLWRLGVTPAWQWDEAVYWQIGLQLQQHGRLAEHYVYGLPHEPFLYQPPFYFLGLAQWFRLTGASIFHARVLGVGFTALMQVVLFRLLWKLHGLRPALFAIIPVIFDGWLLYIERVSYIENALMLLIVGAFLLYQRALEHPSWQRFALAGVAVGSAAVFKQTGVYVLVAVLLCWLIVRRDHRGHLVLLTTALSVIVAYVLVMLRVFSGSGMFIDQSLVQVRRVLGLEHSGGTLTSPGRVLHLLSAQYRFFVPSLILAGAAAVIAAGRTWQCYRARSWRPAQPNALLYSWLVTGVIVFGVSSLKFPQYFALVLVPGYCYLWTEVARWDWSARWKNVAMSVATGLGIGSLLLTVPAFSANSLAEVQHYAATRIPASAIVVTEESIGDLITQPWCTVEKAGACAGGVASYAITWQTYLQSSFDQGDRAFHRLMVGAIAIKRFAGAAGTATVWKLRPIQ
jgi:4-amino-4-deoxy-L-arabinose transferase-like glycosyltransferase